MYVGMQVKVSSLNFLLKVTESWSLIKSQISKPLLIKQMLLRKMVAPDALIYTRRWPLSRQFKPSGKAEHKPGT